jgi:hypothetical protein
MPDHLARRRAQLASTPCFDIAYTLAGGVDAQRRQEMSQRLSEQRIGFIV